jgi:hypothetical protein
MGSAATVLVLYRRILKAAGSFPSVKRNAILRDIKAEFREHKELADPATVQEKIQVAQRSLEELESYVGMAKDGAEISKTLRGSCE